MTKVITYGTYDLLHQRHINLMRREEVLGDYLIVGVTSDNCGARKAPVQERLEAVEVIEHVDFRKRLVESNQYIMIT